jgi:P-type Ca2+ transporter type 2C
LAVDVMSSSGARPPLMERMDRFSRAVAVVVVAAALGIGSLGVVVHGYSTLEMVMFGIALSVAAIPEGLPITITVALANATSRMASRGVIVRRLAAVEGLGSCTLIASDKTGTLTVNELTVRKIQLPAGTTIEVTGEGFTPEGEILVDRQPISLNNGRLSAPPGIEESRLAELPELLRIAVLCNEASLHRQADHSWVWRGDPTDIALLSMAEKAGVEREQLLAELPQVNQIPFEPEYQFSASHHRSGDQIKVFVKGSPERTLSMCHFEYPADRDRLLEQASQMASEGYRVLALASGVTEEALSQSDTPPQPSGLQLAGFVGMIDPLRSGVREAVEACHGAGIKVSMVTGDHPVTARAIARDLGLDSENGVVVQGSEIAAMSQEQLEASVRRSRIFARVAPRQKLQIVNAARSAGDFVAVTGDGVNDAPALRAANIGVAMGKSGTDVARESAELIISDDNFATIVAGVEEGRIAYDNIRKVIFLLVSTGAAEVCLLGLAVISGAPLPLLPVQILWLNLVTSGIQDKPLAFEAAEDDVLKRPPRSPKESIFDQLMIERTLVVAFVMAALGYSSFVWMLKNGWSEPDARNGLLLFLVLMKTFHLGATRSETKYTFFRSPLKSPLLVACAVGAVLVHLLAMFVPFLQSILATQPVTLETFVFFTLVATLVFVAMELHKWSWNCRYAR